MGPLLLPDQRLNSYPEGPFANISERAARLTAATKSLCFIIPQGNSQLKEKECSFLTRRAELETVVNSD